MGMITRSHLLVLPKNVLSPSSKCSGGGQGGSDIFSEHLGVTFSLAIDRGRWGREINFYEQGVQEDVKYGYEEQWDNGVFHGSGNRAGV